MQVAFVKKKEPKGGDRRLEKPLSPFNKRRAEWILKFM